MQVDDKLITRLEEISCLTLSEIEKNRLKTELQEVLDNMAQFREFNAGGAPECSQTGQCANVFRDDEPQTSFDRELILKNAPAKNDGMFVVPKTVE